MYGSEMEIYMLDKKGKKNIIIIIAGGIITGFLNGLFGSGGGTVIVPFMEEFLGVDEHKSHATAILIILFFTIVSLFFYGKSGNLDYSLAIKVSIGGIAGGIIGAKLLKKLSGKIIRRIFGSFMILAATRMFFS